MNFYPSNWYTQIQPANILRIEAIKNYCKIYFNNNQAALVLCSTLMRVQERLPSEMFIRVHRSHLVNWIHVKEIKKKPVMRVEMTNGEYVPVSRRKANTRENPYYNCFC